MFAVKNRMCHILANCKTWNVKFCGARFSSGFGGGRSEKCFEPVDVGDDNGVTYQRDVTIANLKEITEIFQTDLNIPQAHIFSENNLKAVTLASELPWATARDLDGKIVGCVISSRLGDYTWRTTSLFVLPEYRKYGVGEKLYRYANLESLTNYPLGGLSYLAQKVSRSFWPQEQIGDSGAVAFGVPRNYQPKMYPTSGKDFKVVPFQRGLLFDRLVQWDTARVHWVPRSTLLKAMLTPGVVNAYVAVDSSSEEVVGYGVIQSAFNPKSQILGPLYAENDSIAMALLGNLMKHYVEGNNIGVIYFDRNTTMKQVLSDMQLPDVTKTEVRYVNVQQPPEKYRTQVYLHSNCGTMFY